MQRNNIDGNRYLTECTELKQEMIMDYISCEAKCMTQKTPTIDTRINLQAVSEGSAKCEKAIRRQHAQENRDRLLVPECSGKR